MTNQMFRTNPTDVSKPEDTPFTDVTHAHGTNTWEPLLRSSQRIVEQLKATGELTTDDITDLVTTPQTLSNPQRFNSFVQLRVCPTAATHPHVAWLNCWEFVPDKALSETEYKDITSDFDIEAVHESHQRVNADNDPRVHYPRVIEGWYDLIRETHTDDTPRQGLADEELLSNPPIVLDESDLQNCAQYLAELPDIQPPSGIDDRPDWVWVESDDEATDATTTEVEV